MTVDPSVGRRCNIFPSFENKGAGTKRRSARLSRPPRPRLGEKTAGSSPSHARAVRRAFVCTFGGRGASEAARLSALELDSRDQRTPPVLYVLAENREYEEEAEQSFLVSMWLSLGIPQGPNWPGKKLGLLILDVESTNFYF
jgi:hypothetical protein